MIIKRIVNRFRAQDWTALISELVIVVVGIFIAIQADRWWEQQDDLQQEQQYVDRIVRDIERDIEKIEFAISLAQHRLRLADLIIAVAEDPQLARNRPVEFMMAVHQSSFTHTPSLNSATFDELRSSGRLGLLRDDNLKSALFEYYGYDESARQYISLQLMTEIRHFELAAGILTNKQYVWMQDEIGYVAPDVRADIEFTEKQLDELVEAATRLQNSEEFVAWLPEGRSMQLELIGTHSSRLSRAQALLEILRGSGEL